METTTTSRNAPRITSSISKEHDTGPIYFSSPTDPEFGFLANDYDFRFCLMDPETGLQEKDVDFYNVDQFFQWQKAHTFGDHEKGNIVRMLSSPAQCIQLGRTISNFQPEQWDEERANIMESGVFAKFWSPHPSSTSSSSSSSTLMGKLLATSSRELVFASTSDRIWGIGFDAQEAGEHRDSDWGQNLLGQALMGARDMIKEWTSLRVSPGNLLSGHEEFMYRTALMRRMILWKSGDDGKVKLEVVEARCTPGEELETIKKMAHYGNQDLQNPLLTDVLTRLRRNEDVWKDLAKDDVEA